MFTINGHSSERINDFCIWAVERDGVIIANCYGGGSLSIAVAIIEGKKNKNQPNSNFGEFVSEYDSKADAYAIKGYGPNVLAYVYGDEAKEAAEYAVNELNRNNMFFDGYMERARTYMQFA